MDVNITKQGIWNCSPIQEGEICSVYDDDVSLDQITEIDLTNYEINFSNVVKATDFIEI